MCARCRFGQSTPLNTSARRVGEEGYSQVKQVSVNVWFITVLTVDRSPNLRLPSAIKKLFLYPRIMGKILSSVICKMCKFFWPSRNSGQLLHTCRKEPYLCRCDSDGNSSVSAMRSDEDSLRSLRGPGEARKWSPVEIRLSNLTPSSTAYKWSADSTSALALRKNNHGTYNTYRCH